MIIRPINAITGEINVPGDKSISHRAAICSAMAEGTSFIKNYSSSVDCTSTLECLKALGVSITWIDANLLIEGVGKTGFAASSGPLDCGNSGTTIRLLAGLLAGQDFDSVLTGDESLRKRPMKRIIKPLGLMGAEISSENGAAPLAVSGRNPLAAVSYELPIASAQLKSAIILAGLNADGPTIVESPPTATRLVPSRNHTELMLSYFGATLSDTFVEADNGFRHQITVEGESKLMARDLEIPGDISSTSFFLVAASCLEGSSILIRNIGLNPTRSAIIDVLIRLGAQIEISNKREICNEMVGDLRVRGNFDSLAGDPFNTIGGDIIANLIDEIPILAVMGTQLEGGLEIRDATELRVKESDRIDAIVRNLRSMHAEIEEFPDGFCVKKSELKGARIDSAGDHRIAMAFSVAGFLAEGETYISSAECVEVSFPDFFDVLARIAT